MFLIATWCLLLPQDSLRDLDSPDPVLARLSLERAIRGGDETALEAAAKTSVRARLALAEVRAHKRFGDAYPMPRTVTIELKGEPFPEALAKFSKAAGLRIEPQAQFGPGPKPSPEGVTLSLTEAYVLEAIDGFSRAANVSLWHDGEMYRYYHGGTAPKRVGYSRHVALSLRSILEKQTGNALGESTVSARLDFAGKSDGDIRIAAHGPFVPVEVHEKSGVSLITDGGPKYPPTGAWTGQTGFATGAEIKTPSGDCEELRIVRGAMVVLLPQDTRFGELALNREGAEISGENIVFHLEKVQRGGALIKVICRIPDSQKPNVRPVAADFALTSEDGRLLKAKAKVSGPQNAPEADLQFDIPVGFKAARLRLRHFASFGTLEIPFEFHDVRIR